MRQSLHPLGLLRDGFDWTGRSSAAAYGLAVLAFVILAAFWVYLETVDGLTRWLMLPIAVLTAGSFIALSGHQMRRLNDMGWPRALWALHLLPGLLLIPSLVTPGGRRFSPAYITNILATLLTLLLALLIITRAFWAPYTMLTAGMKPTLMPGDRVLTSLGRYTPLRGDIIVFDRAGSPMFARTAGLPGDRIQLIDGALHINDQPMPAPFDATHQEVLARQGPANILPRCENGAVAMGAICRKSQFSETFPNGHTHAILNIGPQRSDDTGPFTVPPGHIFVLGDNRDVALDSRIPPNAGGAGFVPIASILGRADRVVFSGDGRYWASFWTWRPGRYMMAVE